MLIGDKLDYAYYTIILKKKKGLNGGGEIRTRDTLLRYTCFPSRRTRPLCDPTIILSISRQSVFKQKNRPGASA